MEVNADAKAAVLACLSGSLARLPPEWTREVISAPVPVDTDMLEACSRLCIEHSGSTLDVVSACTLRGRLDLSAEARRRLKAPLSRDDRDSDLLEARPVDSRGNNLSIPLAHAGAGGPGGRLGARAAEAPEPEEHIPTCSHEAGACAAVDCAHRIRHWTPSWLRPAGRGRSASFGCCAVLLLLGHGDDDESAAAVDGAVWAVASALSAARLSACRGAVPVDGACAPRQDCGGHAERHGAVTAGPQLPASSSTDGARIPELHGTLRPFASPGGPGMGRQPGRSQSGQLPAIIREARLARHRFSIARASPSGSMFEQPVPSLAAAAASLRARPGVLLVLNADCLDAGAARQLARSVRGEADARLPDLSASAVVLVPRGLAAPPSNGAASPVCQWHEAAYTRLPAHLPARAARQLQRERAVAALRRWEPPARSGDGTHGGAVGRLLAVCVTDVIVLPAAPA